MRAYRGANEDVAIECGVKLLFSSRKIMFGEVLRTRRYCVSVLVVDLAYSTGIVRARG